MQPKNLTNNPFQAVSLHGVSISLGNGQSQPRTRRASFGSAVNPKNQARCAVAAAALDGLREVPFSMQPFIPSESPANRPAGLSINRNGRLPAMWRTLIQWIFILGLNSNGLSGGVFSRLYVLQPFSFWRETQWFWRGDVR
jgi:hypothetical protein